MAGRALPADGLFAIVGPVGGTSTGVSDSPSSDLAWLPCDCVVVYASPEWKQELRSNRYHWMRRWAQHLPVVMVQPDVAPRHASWAEPAPGINGCELLHVERCASPARAESAVTQARAIARRLDERGLSRPLSWTYFPMLALASALTPATVRVHHATENYYHYPGLPEDWFWSLALCVRTADLVVSVSSGVRASLEEHEPQLGDALVEVANGCDFAQATADPRPDPSVARLAARWRRTLVYAGNVNGRLDIELMHRIVRAEPDSLVLLIGPFGGLNAVERALWQRVLAEPNVHHEEGMDPDRLPSVYRVGDVGIVPYRHLPNIVDDGFPLKVLEMAATGLPIVSSLMRPLVGLHAGIRVASDRDEFLAALPETGRAVLGEDVTQSLVALAQANDYDRKFDDVLAHMRDRDLSDVRRTRYDIAAEIDQERAASILLAPEESDYRPLLTRAAQGAVSRTHDAIVPRIPAPARARMKRLAKRATRS